MGIIIKNIFPEEVIFKGIELQGGRSETVNENKTTFQDNSTTTLTNDEANSMY